MTNQVPKTDGRGFPSGAYLNQNHPMDRTQWLEDTFPEWGSFLNQEIENYEVPKGQVSLWWCGGPSWVLKTDEGGVFMIDQYCGPSMYTELYYPGPSLVIAYCPCIEHGMKCGMGLSQLEEKKAVECGYWHLYRYDPRLKQEGKNPFTLDSKEPTGDFQQFLMGQNRYASLKLSFPKKAQELYDKATQDAQERYSGYRRLADQH